MKSKILRLRRELALLLAAVAVPAAAAGQDSTSNTTPGLPGDAVDPHLVAEQQNDYVVDLAAFRSSWGNTFTIAPLAKSSAEYTPAPTFFNALVSASAMSNDQLVAVPFARDSYAFWDEAGRGINDDPTLNDAPNGSVNTSQFVGNQFGFAFAEFSEGSGVSFNNVVAGVANYEMDLPSRLYVSRVMAGVNSPTWFCNLAQFGMGAVDSDGFVHVRADNFGAADCGGFSVLQGNNYFRIDTLGRNAGVVNVISNSGGADATAHLLQNLTGDCAIGGGGFPHTHSPPSCIPSSVTGGLPITIGSAFACEIAGFLTGQFLYGSSNPLTATTTHVTGASDVRGVVSYSKHNFATIFPGSTRGTAGTLGASGGTEDRLQLWGLSASGAPVSPLSLQVVGAVTDNDDAFSTTVEFTHFYSQTAFRGGNGQVAIGRDQAGRLLAAATAEHPAHVTGNEPDNAIVVARRTSGGATAWTLAAWVEDDQTPPGTGSPATGKDVYDGQSGAPIGHLSTLDDLTNGTTAGPSLSSPMIDSVGNVYFVGVVAYDTGDTDVSLLRAVYQPASFSYRLEAIVSAGDVFHGQNSDTDYQVRFITLADDNSIDSGAPFSGNICQDAYNGNDPAGLSPSDPDTLGGVVFAASIVYDVDGNGEFETTGDVANTADEQYEVLLYVSSGRDCNENGVPDDLDIENGTSLDLNGDGVPDDCSPGMPLCFGDGSGAACGCLNESTPGLGQGCLNGLAVGARLSSSGMADTANDSVVLTVSGVRTQPGLAFQGNNAIGGGAGSTFGDGIRCCGGGVVRLEIINPPAGPEPVTVMTTVTISATGPPNTVNPGDTQCYQYWYRDPVISPCGSNFNLSNALLITWQ